MKYLNQYTTKKQALDEYKASHREIFDTISEMESDLRNTEELLKAEARNEKAGAENKFFRVIYTPAVKKSYDYAKIEKYAKPDEKKLIDAKAVQHSVDYKAMQNLVKSGLVSIDLERKVFEQKELTPRISIQPVQEEESND
jgi:hypothetical protein